jgi:hypothetical protein
MAKGKHQRSGSDGWSGRLSLESQLSDARRANAKLVAESERLECLAGGLMFACEALIGAAKRLMLTQKVDVDAEEGGTGK